MSKSVTLSFGEPEPPAAPPRPFNPASMTRDERTSAGWQTLFVGWVIGLPSIMAVAFVGLVGLWYAWQFTNDLQTWLALSAGLIAITLFSAGMPIAWSLNRETQPVAAKAAAAFGLACVAMNFGIMTHFATHKPELVQMERAPSEEVRQAIAEIAWRREDLGRCGEASRPLERIHPNLVRHHASGAAAFRTHRWRAVFCAGRSSKSWPRSGKRGDFDDNRQRSRHGDFRRQPRGDPDRKGGNRPA